MRTPAGTAYDDQMRRRTADAIRRYGCLVTYVSEDGPCDECRALGSNRAQRRADARAARRRHGVSTPAAFAYTTGLHGRELTPGELVATVGPGVTDLLVEPLPNPGEILFSANKFYGRPPFASVDALQLSWPDALGRYPADPGCVGPAARKPRPGTYRA